MVENHIFSAGPVWHCSHATGQWQRNEGAPGPPYPLGHLTPGCRRAKTRDIGTSYGTPCKIAGLTNMRKPPTGCRWLKGSRWPKFKSDLPNNKSTHQSNIINAHHIIFQCVLYLICVGKSCYFLHIKGIIFCPCFVFFPKMQACHQLLLAPQVIVCIMSWMAALSFTLANLPKYMALWYPHHLLLQYKVNQVIFSSSPCHS